MASKLKSHYPWISTPLISSAPMGGFAGADLAVAVSQAGGVGFIGTVIDMGFLDAELTSAASVLTTTSNNTLPIGVGFLLFAAKLHEASPIIAHHKPAIIWLACPQATEDFVTWTNVIRHCSPSSRIWCQVASVAVAMELAEKCSPDVLVMQGADAGGHGPCPGAGIVSLVPETRDALDAAGHEDVILLAAGGISDGRGVAAALACGAEGAVMGTCFLASEEIVLPVAEFRQSILAAKDGGTQTARGTIFDELKGPNIWPAGYDGRAIAGASYTDFKNGVAIEELRKRNAAAMSEGHKGFGGDIRAALWAGTGVGLVNEVKSAKDIVEEVRRTARKSHERMVSLL
ncbi:hypothetical protein BP6252_04627 [Coleophoma cylindrospora]|uniref:Uncharacterized protein n=1 Tax=Coleophoma cylindrospora TaxID=1849047 RepID=A0A3D8S118_9HELO|nr:hypothetical protein BP6252_04627 [Coleophoma cylindrospora]